MAGTTVKKSAMVSRSPGYYIRQRLFRNGPAMAGLAVILIAVFIAVSGYLFLPDASPDANNGIVTLQKKSPGYTVKLLQIPVANPAETAWYEKWLFGTPPQITNIPFKHYAVAGKTVIVEPLQTGATPDTSRLRIPVSTFQKKGNALPTGEAAMSRYLAENNTRQQTFWFGTDKAGRDVLSRLLLGTRISLGIGFVAVLISVVIGLFIGSLAGYVGGWVDKAMMFLMTVIWSVPGIMLVIAITLALNSKSVWVSFVAVGLTMWVDVARVVRGQILSLREKTYIEAAKVTGLNQSRIILNHLFPNMLGPLIVTATANFAAAILMEAGLSFLGLGVQPPTPSWGLMVNEGFQLIGSSASLFLVVLPSLCISVLVLAFNLLGNGLRDAYDPKIIVTNG